MIVEALCVCFTSAPHLFWCLATKDFIYKYLKVTRMSATSMIVKQGIAVVIVNSSSRLFYWYHGALNPYGTMDSPMYDECSYVFYGYNVCNHCEGRSEVLLSWGILEC